MSDLLSIGSSGIGAYQRALATISNNIANVNTDGYTRQDIAISSNQPRLMGRSYMGTGAYFDGVQRQYDAFVESNLRNSNSALKTQEPLLSYVNRLIDVMGDESIGLTAAMKQFFESARDLATDPASVIQRSIFMRDADGLASRFRQLDSHFVLLENETAQALETDVGQLNSLTTQLAQLNRQLGKHAVVSKQPSELLDQRDLLLRELSSLTEIKTSFAANGAVKVSVGDTINQGVLVDGSVSKSVGLEFVGESPRFTIDPYGQPETMPPITNGRMGGLLMFREQVLEQARGALDTLAKTVVQEVNAVHRSGLDAEGRLGGDLFRMDTSSRGPAAGIVMAIQDANRVAAAGQFRVINNSLNTGNAQARVAFTAPEYAGVSGLVGDLAAGQSPRIGQESIRVGTSPPFAPIGTIPTGSQDVVIALNNPPSGLSLQVITRDGRHVLGQALTNAERDLLMQGQQGMEAGATYNADQINGAVDTNPNTPTPYMNMDLFVGAKGDVRLLQRFNPATGDALAPEAAAARLTANAAPPATLGSIPAGRFVLNGVSLSAFDPAGSAPMADQLATWLNSQSAATGVNASVEDGVLRLSRPDANTTDDIRLAVGPSAQQSDLQKLGFSPSVYLKGVAKDDLLVFVTNRSGSTGDVDVSAEFEKLGGDLQQSLREGQLRVRFTSDTAYEIVDQQSGSVLAERTFNRNNPAESIAYRGLNLSFSTAPRKGDEFTIDGNRDGIGNNEAMLALVALENEAIMPGGLTASESYIERVNQVGNVARQAAISQQALTVVYEQAREARDGVSGVSLDQEAAALVRFQQAYQANAKVMQIASQLFDSILQVR